MKHSTADADLPSGLLDLSDLPLEGLRDLDDSVLATVLRRVLDPRAAESPDVSAFNSSLG